jgi:hypothetical protein
MSADSLSRRDFLKTSGGVLVGTLAFASGPIALLAPSRSWSLDLQTLTGDEGELLLQMTRGIYPHPALEDAVYAKAWRISIAQPEASGANFRRRVSWLFSPNERPRPSFRRCEGLRWCPSTTTSWLSLISGTRGPLLPKGVTSNAASTICSGYPSRMRQLARGGHHEPLRRER